MDKEKRKMNEVIKEWGGLFKSSLIELLKGFESLVDLTKKELNKVKGAVKKEGFSIIPINLFFNEKGLAKLTFGLGKGKKKFDKREHEKTKDWNKKKLRLLKNS